MNIIFFGTPDFSVATLAKLLSLPRCHVKAVVTQPDRPAGRGGKIKQSPIKELAASHNIPVLQPTSLRKELPLILSQLQELGPFDIGIVIAFGQILPKEILDLPRRGCVNIHASLLPRWRGAAPIQRALAAGDKETGVCLMQMDVGLDTGDVFCEARIPIQENNTGETLHNALATTGADLLASQLEKIVSGTLQAAPQSADGVTYAAKITAEDCKIDWDNNAALLARTVRALSPMPGCVTFWRGKRLKILFATTLIHPRSQSQLPAPGTIIRAHSGRLEIQCGEGILAVEHLQLEGKKRMTTEEFLRGTGLTEGEVLG